MLVTYHPLIYGDVDAIMSHYESTVGAELADDFYRELEIAIQKIGSAPFSYAARLRDVRRINLRKYPYHVLFRIVDETAKILVVRHHKRDPSFGAKRR